MNFKTSYSRIKTQGIKFLKSSKTIQSAKDECDINVILKKYAKTGVLPDMIKSNPQYGDFSNLESYQSSMEIVLKAQEQFQSLSAKIRQRFNNDAGEFLEFATNPSNATEMIKLGLATNAELNAVKTQFQTANDNYKDTSAQNNQLDSQSASAGASLDKGGTK